MPDSEWEDAYHLAWKNYFSYEHLETVIRRHAARERGQPERVTRFFRDLKQIIEIEGVQPLEGGVLRRRSRLDRRPGMAIESPFTFYPKSAWSTATKLKRYVQIFWNCHRIYKRVLGDPKRLQYRDIAITPASKSESDELDLFNETHGGIKAVGKVRVQDEIKKRVLQKAAG